MADVWDIAAQGLTQATPTPTPSGGDPWDIAEKQLAIPTASPEGGPRELQGFEATPAEIMALPGEEPAPLTRSAAEIQKPIISVADYIKGMITSLPEQYMAPSRLPSDWTDLGQLAELAFPQLTPVLDIPKQVQSRIQQIQEADQTPPWSQERWNAGIATAADLAGLAAMAHGAIVSGEGIPSRAEPSVADAIRAQTEAPPAPPPTVPQAPAAQPEIITPELGSPFHPPEISPQDVPYAGGPQAPAPPAAEVPAATGANVKGFEQTYGPGEIPAGPTITPEDAWDAAGERARAGTAQPYNFVDRARTGAITPEEMADLIYEHQRLVNQAGAAEGTPQYNELYQRARTFAENVVKPAENAWHRQGQTMQIAVPSDFTSETGMRVAAERMGSEITASEVAEARRIARENKTADQAVQANGQKMLDAMDREYSRGARRVPKTAEQLRAQLADKDPCVFG